MRIPTTRTGSTSPSPKPDTTDETSIDDPHYAGSFAFFFDESAMKDHAAGKSAAPLTGFLVDVKNTLETLNQAGSLSAAQMQVSASQEGL